MKVLDLFSGIGGFSLGLERAGMETIAFCEIDESCRNILRKHWPEIIIYKDVKQINNDFIRSGVHKIFGTIDVICGGFPCQDISIAGQKKGLKGERSGLWKEFKRIIKEVKPRYAIIENVANLRSNGLTEVIKDLWSIGYGCEWHIISARSAGAPHLRERIWIIAYPDSSRLERLRISERVQEKHSSDNSSHDSTSNSYDFRFWKPFASEKEKSEWWAKAALSVSHWKEAQSIVRGVDDGLPRGMDKGRRERIKQLGNSVVPQIPELIGRAIMEYEHAKE